MARSKSRNRPAHVRISMDSLGRVTSKKLRSTSARRALANGNTAVKGRRSDRAIRVVLYLRVSSKRSVESNLSIPEQEAQLRRYCEERGLEVVAVYVEPGKSAKTTNRPQFRMMVEDAQALERPFDKILIWTTSRFARSSSDYAIVEKLLRVHDIEVLSVSQSFAKNAGGLVAKRISTLFDEYHSHRSAEDSLNARRQMVQNGWWPGGKPPDGLKLIPAPNNSQRKVVTFDEDRRPVIERIYDLTLHGDGTSPPLGIKAIAKWLNTRGITTRAGSRWGNQTIHRILTNSAYFGDYYWGVDPAINEFREELEPALLRVPAIVSKSTFEDVQLILQRRDPKTGKAKQMSSPLLLSGLARCSECGASMTLRTGKGGAYRYYYCSAANRGKMVCSGPRIPEKVLDEAVLTAVRSRVLDQGHLSELILGLQRRRQQRASSAMQDLPALQSRVSVAEASIEGLLASIRLAPSLESDPLFQRNLHRAADELGMARTRLTEATAAIGRTDEVTEEAIAHFRTLMIGLLERESPARTKIYLSTVLERIEVGTDEIRIEGHIDDLRKAVVSSTQGSGGNVLPEVRRYVRRWRSRRDSNPR
ncbi:recombinase family protein [Nitrobacter vulgaris]|uniref:Recombinase family protein n=1 Tax=Nitrobacter vulgaris TaxID=29421 RepID=A0A1V4HZW6_NITVU|nr:recombinase family protein [Nitrobacter vulgaris]OPH83122.1 hypothetical protein B2M20_09080 [Nitrobacter vulgaris]